VKLLKVNASKNVVMVTLGIETEKTANLVTKYAKLASMIVHIVLHQKLAKPNSWVNSMKLVQTECKKLQLLLVMIHGTSVAVLKTVLLTLVSFKMICT